jgi:hypothetical protein
VIRGQRKYTYGWVPDQLEELWREAERKIYGPLDDSMTAPGSY